MNFSWTAFAQVSIGSDSVDYASPKEYELTGITVSGIKYLDESVLIHLTGLKIGDKIMIPGEKMSAVVQKLWEQGLFSDIKITVTKILGKSAFIDIYLQERKRLSKFSFQGTKKSEADDLREKIKFIKGEQVTDNTIINAKNLIKQYYVDKGYLYADVQITQLDDSALANSVILNINVDKKERVKIKYISFQGNNANEAFNKELKESNKSLWARTFHRSPFADKKLRRSMKETKIKRWYGMFKTSKFIADNYKSDKQKIIEKYNENGYRDATITSDSINKISDKLVGIKINISEGRKYFFRNITWVGNTKYSSAVLSKLLDIKKGEVFNESELEAKLNGETGVSSLYYDDGYLFFQLAPIETAVDNDSIDYEMQITEGKQAKINKIIITGNTKTNEHVIRREIRTMPGQLFSRSDIYRTMRELSQLGYFDPQKIKPNPIPNPVDGTVDIEYSLEEKPSDQIELSGGYGANQVVGTLGLTFSNFSIKNFFNKSAWQPLPSGDGERLSVRAQTNGTIYQSYNMSFVEPWLGGKKPNSLSVSFYHTIYSNGLSLSDINRQSMKISGVALGLGRRLKKPDDYFSLYNELSYQFYNLNHYNYNNMFTFDYGKCNIFSIKTTIERNSVDEPIYPKKGSDFIFSLELTPPYSLFNNKNYSTMVDQEKYKYLEYHKWDINTKWYLTIVEKLVLMTSGNFGFLGMYNRQIGYSPFGGYVVGGSGLISGYYGKQIVALRGYSDGALSPTTGANVYDKFTLELRYPVALEQSVTLYGLAFLEGGNSWYDFKDYKPFEVKRSAGVGIRIFLPMMGKLGVDWGYGFDEAYKLGENHSQFHFIIGQDF